MLMMRTTIDLPDDLHRVASAIARDQKMSLSATLAQLVRQALGGGEAAAVTISQRTGLPVVGLGQIITTDDVRALEDDS